MELTSQAAKLLCEYRRKYRDFRTGFIAIQNQVPEEERPVLQDFCTWLDEEAGGASVQNIQTLFLAWRCPDNEELQQFFQSHRAKMAILAAHLFDLTNHLKYDF